MRESDRKRKREREIVCVYEKEIERQSGSKGETDGQRDRESPREEGV